MINENFDEVKLVQMQYDDLKSILYMLELFAKTYEEFNFIKKNSMHEILELEKLFDKTLNILHKIQNKAAKLSFDVSDKFEACKLKNMKR